MCGIIGYIGKKRNIQEGINMLKRLEYRGYDSSGVAWYDCQKNKISFVKKEGKIEELEKAVLKSSFDAKSKAFILHTRWATHGMPSDVNAHPHVDCKKEIFVVHNGIIENYLELKEKLQKEGHRFISETDTEVLAHLIEKYFTNNLEEATRLALKEVIGAYAIAVISSRDPQKIVFARQSSPLLVGLGRGENFIASDAPAILGHTRKVVYLDDVWPALIDVKEHRTKGKVLVLPNQNYL